MIFNPQQAATACWREPFTCLWVGMDEDIVISGGIGPVQTGQT